MKRLRRYAGGLVDGAVRRGIENPTFKRFLDMSTERHWRAKAQISANPLLLEGERFHSQNEEDGIVAANQDRQRTLCRIRVVATDWKIILSSCSCGDGAEYGSEEQTWSSEFRNPVAGFRSPGCGRESRPVELGLARRMPRTFHLFEPNSKLLESIEKGRKLYPPMRAEINPVAVCDQDGTVCFAVQGEQTSASHITNTGGVAIQSIRLDTYLKNQGVDKVDLLKIDIEGYELTALRGAEHSLRSRLIKAIYFEYFEKYLVRVAPPAKLIEFLDSLSYEVRFCRESDLTQQDGAPRVTVREGLPGHGLPLIPIAGRQVPAMTDLLAVPKENLVRL